MELSIYRSRSQPQWRTALLPNRLTGLFLLNFIGIHPRTEYLGLEVHCIQTLLVGSRTKLIRGNVYDNSLNWVLGTL
jgi:hypothetical protein